MARFSSEIGDFAIKIGELQEMRHRADHDPSNRLSRRDVLKEIDAAEAAIKRPKTANTKDKRAFAAWTVKNKRPDWELYPRELREGLASRFTSCSSPRWTTDSFLRPARSQPSAVGPHGNGRPGTRFPKTFDPDCRRKQGLE